MYNESGAFRRKFDSLTDDHKLARLLYEISKEMLFHRSGTRIEDMYSDTYWKDMKKKMLN